VPYSPASKDAPNEVVELAEASDRIGAIRKYRELTGCGSGEAKEVVAGL
jgi:ribosomal protein L7/L12